MPIDCKWPYFPVFGPCPGPPQVTRACRSGLYSRFGLKKNTKKMRGPLGGCATTPPESRAGALELWKLEGRISRCLAQAPVLLRPPARAVAGSTPDLGQKKNTKKMCGPIRGCATTPPEGRTGAPGLWKLEGRISRCLALALALLKATRAHRSGLPHRPG